jgi:hypothetical protein
VVDAFVGVGGNAIQFALRWDHWAFEHRIVDDFFMLKESQHRHLETCHGVNQWSCFHLYMLCGRYIVHCLLHSGIFLIAKHLPGPDWQLGTVMLNIFWTREAQGTPCHSHWHQSCENWVC